MKMCGNSQQYMGKAAFFFTCSRYHSYKNFRPANAKGTLWCVALPMTILEMAQTLEKY